MTLSFELSPTKPNEPIPTWKDGEFYIGDKKSPVLQYSENLVGWNSELTILHEENVGEKHFIECASRQHAIQQIQKYVTKSASTILEVGCSSGFLLKELREKLPAETLLMGADVISEPLLVLSKEHPTVPFFQFDLMHCPLPSESVDAVVTLNVLEHIEDDFLALQQIHRILKPGGTLVLELPAGPDLYDIYDKVLMHYRRYSLSNLSNLVKKAGFNILKQSHLGFFVYPGFWAVKKRNQRLLEADILEQQANVQKSMKMSGSNQFMHKLMQMELSLGEKISYPFGIRCLITCQKPY